MCRRVLTSSHKKWHRITCAHFGHEFRWNKTATNISENVFQSRWTQLKHVKPINTPLVSKIYTYSTVRLHFRGRPLREGMAGRGEVLDLSGQKPPSGSNLFCRRYLHENIYLKASPIITLPSVGWVLSPCCVCC